MENLILTPFTAEDLKQFIGEAVENALNQKSGNPQEQGKEILNFEQGCKHLGISKSHGYKLTSQRLVPHSKRGKRIFFDKAELDKWLLEEKVKTLADYDKEAEARLNTKLL